MSRRDLQVSRFPILDPTTQRSAAAPSFAHSGRFAPAAALRLLRRRWPIVVATPLAALGIAIVALKLTSPLYTATSTVLVDPRRSLVADPGDQPVSSTASVEDASIESQVRLIQSVAVLQHVVEELNLTRDPEFAQTSNALSGLERIFVSNAPPAGSAADVAKAGTVANLQKRIRALRERNTLLVDIKATSHDPIKAAALANAVARAYFLEQMRSRYHSNRIASDWLNRQTEQFTSRILAAEKAIDDVRAAETPGPPAEAAGDQPAIELRRELAEARARTMAARARYEQAAQTTNGRSRAGALASAGAGNSQRLAGDDARQVLRSRWAAYESAVSLQASLQRTLDELQGDATRSGQPRSHIRELQQEADANRALYESLLARQKEVRSPQALELPEARVVAQAEAPIRPSFPDSALTLGLAPLIGLGFGCMLAFIADRRDRRIKTLDEAQLVVGAEGLAAIPLVSLRELARMAKRGSQELGRYDANTMPLLPPALQPPLMRYAVEAPTSSFAEAIRAVRLAVQRASHANAAQVVVTTSALDEEGKTTLAANLAGSFAAIGTKTVLVEGDLRNPELTRSLCPHARLGLVEVATGAVPLGQAVLVDQSTGLSVLPAPRPRNSALADFVSSIRMSAVLAELRAQFQVIVIDSPPLIPMVDARALAEQADHVVLAIAWNRTSRDLVLRAAHLLAPAQEHILGTVLTQVDLHRLHHYDNALSAADTKRYRYAYGIEAAE